MDENTNRENNGNPKQKSMDENTNKESNNENLKKSDLEMSNSSHWGSDSDNSNTLSEAMCKN